MSTPISCSRAVLPRVTSKVTRCRRLASTQTVASDSAATSLSNTQLPKQYPEALSVKMHRRLYPEYYERKDKFNWEPRDVVPYQKPRSNAKPVAAKWAPVMRQSRVQTNLSMCTNIHIEPPDMS